MEEKLRQAPSNCFKVVLFGPESTGKTTLSRQLASHYQTDWVPEFAREYLQKKWNKTGIICEFSDILPIAIGQMRLENSKAEKADEILFCDTDLLETAVYSQAYYNDCPSELLQAIPHHHYDLYLLTYIDVPWEPDDLRDRPNQRAEMFAFFQENLEKYNRNYVLLRGDQRQRLEAATRVIDKLVSKK
ncbi:MAG: ATP-binding protein [Bacteroidetes bacterium]|nr:ATP-binding protein [Bacteroidota bacterium]